jgi:hypothetical protein
MTPSELHELKFLKPLPTKSRTPIRRDLFAGGKKAFAGDRRGLAGKNVKGDSSERRVDWVIVLGMRYVTRRG